MSRRTEFWLTLAPQLALCAGLICIAGAWLTALALKERLTERKPNGTTQTDALT